ncbi:superoxide dismutase [candidate division WWE3 bacterium]|nr:superoxide dismutase [candidate division WWE3 bacterium]
MAEPFKLPTLKYSYDALEPYIDAKTMEIHYTKHHAAYIANLNKALENFPQLQEKTIEELLSNLESIPTEIRQAVINHGGGHYNHSLFWEIMSPTSTKLPTEKLLSEIVKTFTSFENFKFEFSKAATSRFGSGWAWLVVDKDSTLKVVSSANQDSPISQGQKPILGLDVWEHAYYLNYQNKRADYIEAFWNIIDWVEVEKRFQS